MMLLEQEVTESVGRESPAIARRQLAAELRRLRHSDGRTLEEVAERLGCTAGKISRIETGIVRAQAQDVGRLLDLYRTPVDRRQALLALLHESRKREWWRSYTDVVPPAAAEFFSLEAAATVIRAYGQALVPGLLQTERYARAIIGSRDDDPKVIDRRIELRMRRQELLTADDAPACTFLIDEATLRKRVGDRQVMRAQLERFLAASVRSNVTLRIVPDVAHPAVGTNFTIFGFAQSEYGSVTFIETLTRNLFIDDPGEVRFYAETFSAVEKLALSPESSRRLLEAATR